jgi:hypothetical protein
MNSIEFISEIIGGSFLCSILYSTEVLKGNTEDEYSFLGKL